MVLSLTSIFNQAKPRLAQVSETSHQIWNESFFWNYICRVFLYVYAYHYVKHGQTHRNEAMLHLIIGTVGFCCWAVLFFFLAPLLKPFDPDSGDKWFNPTISFLLDSKDYENNIKQIFFKKLIFSLLPLQHHKKKLIIIVLCSINLSRSMTMMQTREFNSQYLPKKQRKIPQGDAGENSSDGK